ncbi:MAG: carbohydrate ABC transporter permease [Spirochaetia bacterium]
MKRSTGENIFDTANILFLIILSITILIPMLHIIANSLSDSIPLMRGDVKLWPVGLNIDNYILVVKNSVFLNSFKITFFLVTFGTLVNLFLTFITAYPLSRPGFRGRKFFMLFILFTLIFKVPVIPLYLVVRSLRIINTVWAMIIPTAIQAFNLILCVTFFKTSIPSDLIDAAKVDGMSEYGILARVVLPLSKPIVMTLLLFYAVHHWNSYYHAILFITDHRLRPLQLYLYQMLSQSDVNDAMANANELTVNTTPKGIISATVVAATMPIVIVYPFIQKHFVKGALLGSIKE